MVLCVDFTQAKVRAQRGFADLTDLLPGETPVAGTVETAWQEPGSPQQRLERWLANSEQFGHNVRAVFGFCAGGALASALARRLADRFGTAPRLVLFDPSQVDAQTLHYQFTSALASLASTLAADDVREAEQAARQETDAATDLESLAASLADRYTVLSRQACAKQGVPPAIADQLSARICTHLRYLALSAATPLSCGQRPLLVLSAGYQAPPVPDAVQRRIDVDQAALLGDPATARAAVEWLADAPATARTRPA